MRPPICFVCNRDVVSSTAELVRFVASERGSRWEQRVEESATPLTGHHPDKGWFCETHRAPATALATTHTIDDALIQLRQETS